MKEKLYTIELHDALVSGDECPFCWLERKLEQAAIEFVLGSSYMESDTRDQTDRQGFCRKHTKMMYDYGNTLGNADHCGIFVSCRLCLFMAAFSAVHKQQHNRCNHKTDARNNKH